MRIESRQVYITEDGREFFDKGQAVQHEAVNAVLDVLEIPDADGYVRSVIETLVTRATEIRGVFDRAGIYCTAAPRSATLEDQEEFEQHYAEMVTMSRPQMRGLRRLGTLLAYAPGEEGLNIGWTLWCRARGLI